MDHLLEVEVQLCQVCQCEVLGTQRSGHDSCHEVCLLDVADVFPSSGLSSPQVLSPDSPGSCCGAKRRDVSLRTTRFYEPKLDLIVQEQLWMLDHLVSLTHQIHGEMQRYQNEVERSQLKQRELLMQITASMRRDQSSSDDRDSQVTVGSWRRHDGLVRDSYGESQHDSLRDSGVLSIVASTAPPESIPPLALRTQATSQSEYHNNHTWKMSVHSAFEVAMLATQPTNVFDVVAKSMHLPGAASSWCDRRLRTLSQQCSFFTRRRLHLNGLRRFVEGDRFQTLIIWLIVAYSVFIGISTNHAVSQSFDAYDARSVGKVHRPGSFGWVRACEEAFAVIFSVEMAMRVLAHEGGYFLSLWNTGDLCAVLFTVLSTFIPNRTLTIMNNAMVVFRFVRPERLLLVLSFLRFAPQHGGVHLRLLVLACKTSIGALCWATVLLICLLLLSSIVFVQGATAYVDDASPSDPFVEDLREHFRSMPMTMLTLFVCLLGEADFKGIINVLRRVGQWYLVLFIALLLFLTLSVSNVIAGVFVADAIDVAKRDREINMRAQMMEARQNMADLYNLWSVLDVDQQQSLTRDQFREQMRRPAVKHLFSKLKLDVSDVDAFFHLMDADQTGVVDVEEFIVGCMRVRNMSNEVETGITVQETKLLAQRLHRTLKTIQQQSVALHSELQHLSSRLFNIESAVGVEL